MVIHGTPTYQNIGPFRQLRSGASFVVGFRRSFQPMPHRDVVARRAYQRDFYAKQRGRSRGPLGTEDRKVIVNCRVRASIVGRIQRLLLEGTAAGTMTFKSASAFYEHLLIRGLEHLHLDDQSLRETRDEALQYLKAVGETDAIGNHRREAQGAFARVRVELKELTAIKAEAQAVHYYWSTRRSFEQMSANIWRDWFLRELQHAFPGLHASKPTGVLLDDESLGHVKRKKSLTPSPARRVKSRHR